jgi:hypothetical protein
LVITGELIFSVEVLVKACLQSSFLLQVLFEVDDISSLLGDGPVLTIFPLPPD